MLQPRLSDSQYDPEITVIIEGAKLLSVQWRTSGISRVQYISTALRPTKLLNVCISKESIAFGRLTDRLWKSHDIKLTKKISVYTTAVLSTLLYGCETWAPYWKHARRLEAFHMRCARRLYILWRRISYPTPQFWRCAMLLAVSQSW